MSERLFGTNLLWGGSSLRYFSLTTGCLGSLFHEQDLIILMKGLLSKLNLLPLVAVDLLPDVFYLLDRVRIEGEDELPEQVRVCYL